MCNRSKNYGIRLFIPEFQWFFIELSVLPIICLAISAHLFTIHISKWLPIALWYKNRIHSSYSSHEVFFIYGFKWLCHLNHHWLWLYLSRHYFPIRPSRWFAMYVHLFGPFSATNFITSRSSTSVQGSNGINMGEGYFSWILSLSRY